MLNFESIMTVNNKVCLVVKADNDRHFDALKSLCAGEQFSYDSNDRKVNVSGSSHVVSYEGKMVAIPVRCHEVFDIIQSYEMDLHC